MTKALLQVGLKFTSTSFSAEGEICRISESEGIVDVILKPSDGHAWVEKGWNLNEVTGRFKSGEYKRIEPNNVNICII